MTIPQHLIYLVITTFKLSWSIKRPGKVEVEREIE